MEGTIAEIRMFAGNFAPRNWAFCNGQIIAINTNSALFSILGTTFGGNGTTTFALPNFQSRTAIGAGEGVGLSEYQLGQMSGAESVTLQAGNLPAHTHAIGASTGAASVGSPSGNVIAVVLDASRNAINLYHPTANAAMAPTGSAGSSTPFSTLPPYLGMNYIICLQGIYPSRN